MGGSVLGSIQSGFIQSNLMCSDAIQIQSAAGGGRVATSALCLINAGTPLQQHSTAPLLVDVTGR